MSAMLALALLAQVVNPVHGYTTSDPVSPEKLGLATPDGRFLIRAVGQCRSIGPGASVAAWGGEPTEADEQTALLAPIHDGLIVMSVLDEASGEIVGQVCRVVVERRMSETPCFRTDGVCDVRLESDQ